MTSGNLCKFCGEELRMLFISYYCDNCEQNKNDAIREYASEVPNLIDEDYFTQYVDEPTTRIDLADYSDFDLDSELNKLLDDLEVDIDND